MKVDFDTRMKYFDKRLDLGLVIKRVENWENLTQEVKDDTLWYMRHLAENYRPYNNVFNRTPSAASLLGRCLAWAGDWLLKLSERAG